LRARLVIEDIAGCAVLGYRAPGFSAVRQTPWFFHEVERAGYAYDSSLFPAMRGHGGVANAERAPHRVAGTNLIEFPLSVIGVAGLPMCFFGGGYLRLFPAALIVHQAKAVQKEQRPVIFYVHPREIDPAHPRLPMSWRRRFKS